MLQILRGRYPAAQVIAMNYYLPKFFPLVPTPPMLGVSRSLPRSIGAQSTWDYVLGALRRIVIRMIVTANINLEMQTYNAYDSMR